MTVYVLVKWWWGTGRSLDSAILGVFEQQREAFQRAEQRYGSKIEWKHHNSHGTSWESLPLEAFPKFTVEEFEVE